MDYNKLEGVADPTSYQLWIKFSIAMLAAGLIIGGLGHWFAREHMTILGNFLRQPGGVILTTGIAMAGLKGDTLENGVRLTAIIVSGVMARMTLWP